MSFTHRATLAAALLGAVISPAQAQQPTAQTKAAFLETIKSRFGQLDANNDGSLNKDEVSAAQTRVQAEASANIDKQITEAFARLDANKDGSLSLTEFKAQAPKLRPSVGADAAVRRFDSNKDGKVSLSEYQAPLLAQFNAADTNKDGVVSPAEQQAGR